jgi:TonB family protein
MALPEFANQKREQERKALKMLLTRTLSASLALHAALLLLNLKPLWTAAEPKLEEIAIVVTEPLEEVEQVEPEEPPEAETDILTGGGGRAPAATSAEPAPVEPEPIQAAVLPPPEAVSAPVVPPPPQAQQERAIEDLTPVASPAPSSVPSPSPPTPQASPNVAVAPHNTRNLQDLLEQLRRDRESAQPQPNSAGTGSSRNSGSSRGSGSGSGAGSGSGSGAGSGEQTGSGEGRNRPEPRPTPAARSSSPQQIECRDCPDPDYPEAAEGAEGKVRVNVDVDENGNVVGVILTGSSGNAALDQAVLETVRERYEFNGVGAEGASIPVEVDMTLEGSEANRAAHEQGERREVSIPSNEPVAEEPLVPQSPQEAAAPTAPSVEDSPLPQTPLPQTPQEATAPAAPSLPVPVESSPAAAPESPASVASPAANPPAASDLPSAIETVPEIPLSAPLSEPGFTEPEPASEPVPATVEPVGEAPAEVPAFTEPEPVYTEPEPASLPPVEAAPALEAVPTEED